MIRLNELRIGNIIWHNTLGYSIITELRTDGISIIDKNNNGQSIFIGNMQLLKPVDLAIEIILKLGFKFFEGEGDKKDMDYYVHHETAFLLRKHKDDDILTFRIYGATPIELFYLHNLQNLYFIFRGKEFPITL